MGLFDFLKGAPNIEKMQHNNDVDGLIKALKHNQMTIREKAKKVLESLNDERAIRALRVERINQEFKDSRSDKQRNGKTSSHRKIGFGLLLVSFFFFGITYLLNTQYAGGSEKRCEICGAPAEYSKTNVYKSTGIQSGSPKFRCAQHRDSIPFSAITMWIGIPFFLFGVGALFYGES